jgi:hypothetical protein
VDKVLRLFLEASKAAMKLQHDPEMARAIVQDCNEEIRQLNGRKKCLTIATNRS